VNGSTKVDMQEVTDSYAIYHGDCCELIKEVADESIGLTIYSPPFFSTCIRTVTIRKI
jgi:predicted methyltransferase